MKDKMSLVISTYNHKQKLFSLLDTVDTIGFDEIIVVDDHDDYVNEIIEKLRKMKTKTRLILMSRPYGPWATKSVGISVAKNKYVLHLDGDCKPLSKSIKAQHLRWLKKGYLFVFGSLVFSGKSLLTKAFYVRYYLSSNKYMLNKPTEFDGYNIIAISGNNFSMNKQRLFTQKIPNLGLFAGDDLYFTVLNMRKTGLKSVFDPNIVVLHDHTLKFKGLIKKYYTYAIGSEINKRIFGKLSDYYTNILMPIYFSRIGIALKNAGFAPTILFILLYPVYAFFTIIGWTRASFFRPKSVRINYREIKI